MGVRLADVRLPMTADWLPTETLPMLTDSTKSAKLQSSAWPAPNDTAPHWASRVSNTRNGDVSGITRPARVSGSRLAIRYPATSTTTCAEPLLL